MPGGRLTGASSSRTPSAVISSGCGCPARCSRPLVRSGATDSMQIVANKPIVLPLVLEYLLDGRQGLGHRAAGQDHGPPGHPQADAERGLVRARGRRRRRPWRAPSRREPRRRRRSRRRAASAGRRTGTGRRPPAGGRSAPATAAGRAPAGRSPPRTAAPRRSCRWVSSARWRSTAYRTTRCSRKPSTWPLTR